MPELLKAETNALMGFVNIIKHFSLWEGLSLRIIHPVPVPGSSVVEQFAVNELAVGSNPTPGAKLDK